MYHLLVKHCVRVAKDKTWSLQIETLVLFVNGLTYPLHQANLSIVTFPLAEEHAIKLCTVVGLNPVVL